MNPLKWSSFILLVLFCKGGSGWIDRSALDYVNWEPEKPNSQSQTCVAVSSRNGKWHDVSCESRRGHNIYSISKISTNGNTEYTKDRNSHKEGVSDLGAGGIVGTVLCALAVMTIAVTTYCYRYPSMRSVIRLTQSLPV